MFMLGLFLGLGLGVGATVWVGTAYVSLLPKGTLLKLADKLRAIAGQDCRL